MPNNDLISRAALVEDLSYCAPELFFDRDYLLCKIMKQPAVDAVPVVHGRWMDREYSDQKECSECGEICCCQGDYCMNCGAKMDGGEDDG